ncbi:ABC transporter substrate-binding protein [Achromobacter aloeverae]
MKQATTAAAASKSRRKLLLAGTALALPAFAIRDAWAQNKVLRISTYTGPQAEYVRKSIIPAFEKKYGCKVLQTESATLANIAVMRTQRDNPQYSVMMMDDLGIPIAKDEKLIAQLPKDKIPNLANVFPRYVLNDAYGTAFSVSAIAPWYNPTLGSPINSFADLWSDELKGQFMMTTPKLSMSVTLLVAAAALATGKPIAQAQYELDAGWAKMTALKPNVQTIYEVAGTAVLQISQGQAIAAGPDFSKSIYPYMAQGAPVRFSTPTEGAFAGINCLTLVNNAPEPDLGAAFIDMSLSNEFQKGMAEYIYAAPAVKGIDLVDKVAKLVPYPDEKINTLHNLDWAYINPRRSAIIDKFNQVFGA